MATQTTIDRLLAAAEEGDAEKVAKLIKKDRTLAHVKDENGWTALHRAAMFGEVEVVRLLLRLGADPNQQDNKGATPLHDACTGYDYYLPAICELIKQGARLDLLTEEGMTPLMVCALYSNLSGLAFLLGHGANTKQRDRSKRNALGIAKFVLRRSKGKKFEQQRTDLAVMIELLECFEGGK